jgi:protein pelota
MNPANVRNGLAYETLPNHHAELNQLTGVAALLTFPLDVEVVEQEEREAKEEQGRKESESDL